MQLKTELSRKQIDLLKVYQQAVLTANDSFNLVGKDTAKDFWTTHIEDSLALLDFVDLPQDSSLLDVGSGAGFPAVPIKIVRKDLQISVLDATLKRCEFVKNTCENIGVEVEVVAARAEELGHEANFRESYDFVTARAVADLRVLAEICLPFVKVGGKFIALKGPNLDSELECANEIIDKLGGEVLEVHEFSLADEFARKILVIEKKKSTPATFPRRWKRILRG